MSWDVSDDPTQNADAVEWFRDRTPVTEDEWNSLSKEARLKAFKVAGVGQLDVIAGVYAAIDKAVADGTDFETFKKEVGEKLDSAWAGSVDDPANRIETIFRTNVQSSYGAGRYRQMTAPAVAKVRPFFMLDTVRDARQSPICRALSSPPLESPVVLPQDDPYWDTHVPPLHHRCRTGLRALRKTQADASGVTDDPPKVTPGEGFGSPPGEDNWKPDLTKYPEDLRKAYEEKQAELERKRTPTEGVHFKKTYGNASKKAKQNVIDGFYDADILPFLEQHPLNKLVLDRSAGRGVNGWYGINTADLAVSALRKEGTFQIAFDPGKAWSISNVATTADEAVRRTMVHELGHHLHLFDKDQNVDEVIQRAYGSADRHAITKYAEHNHKEYFAESFAAYRFHKAVLEEHDPVGFAMVEKVLKLRGVIS